MLGLGQEAAEAVDGIGSACHRYTPSFWGDRRRNRGTYTSSWPGSQRIMSILRSVRAREAAAPGCRRPSGPPLFLLAGDGGKTDGPVRLVQEESGRVTGSEDRVASG